MVCLKCGKPVKPNWMLCPYCGDRLKTKCLNPDCAQNIQAQQRWNVCPLCGTSTEHGKKQRPSASVPEHLDATSPLMLSKFDIELMPVPRGTFTMGRGPSIPKTEGRHCMEPPGAHWEMGDISQRPAHEVTITKPFWMAKQLVTNRAWRLFMMADGNGAKDEAKNGPDPELPVVNITWDEATAFCMFLMEHHDGPPLADYEFRLPTEAEWEFSATYGGYEEFGEVGCAVGTENNQTQLRAVGQGKPNALGICDMLGNASEWCFDKQDNYPDGGLEDPMGPREGRFRVVRGGAERCNGSGLYTPWLPTARIGHGPDYALKDKGFRVVLAPKTGFLQYF